MNEVLIKTTWINPVTGNNFNLIGYCYTAKTPATVYVKSAVRIGNGKERNTPMEPSMFPPFLITSMQKALLTAYENSLS